MDTNELITRNNDMVNAYIEVFRDLFCVDIEIFGDIYKNPLTQIHAKANGTDIYESFMFYLSAPKLKHLLDYEFMNIAYRFGVPYDEFKEAMSKVYRSGKVSTKVKSDSTHDDIPLEDKKMISDNRWAITKLFDLYSGLISYRLNYGRRFKNDTTITIYIDHKDHEVTEKSIRCIGDLKDPLIISKNLLFLNENYSKLGVSKKDFDDKYTKFLALYLGREKTQMISKRVDYAAEMEKMENDIINHPDHYTKGGIEVRDFIDSWKLDFNSGNVIKYVVRAPYKGTELQDLKKAQNYLNHLIDLKEKEEAKKC